MLSYDDRRLDAVPGDVPLVLLHGFPVDRRMYGPLLEQSAALSAVAIDLPGAGDSALPDAEPSLEVSAAQVVATLDSLGIARCTVAGLSMGGYVAMRMVERYPERIAALALLDTKAEADDDSARAGRLATAARVEAERSVAAVLPMAHSLLGSTTRAQRPEVARKMREWISQADPAYVAWSQRAMAARPDSMEVLRGCTIPAAVIVGDEDDVAPLPRAQAMAQALPQAALVVIPAAGHMSALEQPAAVAASLRDLTQRARH